MSVQFPPRPADTTEIEHIVQVLRGVIQAREAWYVSTPITTGRRLNEARWLFADAAAQAELDEDSLRKHVIEPNREEATALAAVLRESHRRVVINPSGVEDLSGWKQENYLYFWGRVIEEFVECAVFLDGWQYSNGSSYEFFMAAKSNVPTLAADLSPLTVTQGLSLIESALAEVTGLSPIEFLKAVHDALQALLNEAAGVDGP